MKPMPENKQKLDNIRHSLAHLLAASVQQRFPGVKLGIGPTTDDGFYYDFDFPEGAHMGEEELVELEKQMREFIKDELPFSGREVSLEEAKELFKDQPYKLELIEEYINAGEKLSIYKTGDVFVDLCRGGHIKNTENIPVDAFKLTRIAGAYWRGDEKNKMLTRIYGMAFTTKKELDEHLKKLEEAKKRDHRKIGKELELFMMNEEIGQGLILWLPKGALVRKVIEDYLYEELSGAGYEWLYTPHIANRKLWETSGHWNFYNESMYPPIEVSRSLEEAQKNIESEVKEEYLLKPMNCPFHVHVYNSKIRSYRDLPIKFAELGTVYRYERSGITHGLTRVREFTQDDAHLLCRPEQMPEELARLVKHALKMLNDFGFSEFKIYLSTKPEKHTGSEKDWEVATKELENVLKKQKVEYEVDEGGGVFYGPKIDIKIKDLLGREWQCTTIQFDFNLPERFDMSFVNENGEKERPFMIHRALLGSMERFFGVLIEHYAGAFPLWLSPVQVVVIPISEKFSGYAESVSGEFSKEGIRVEVSGPSETLSKRIREAEMQKIPYILVVGEKEEKNNSVNVRVRRSKKTHSEALKDFVGKIKEEIKERR